MSYIHDALKRSQAQRQQAKASINDSFGAVVEGQHVDKRRTSLWVPLSLLVFGAGLLLLAYRLGTVPEALQSAESIAEGTPVSEADSPTPMGLENGHLPAQSAAVAVSVSTPYEELPFYWELPQSIRGQLGELAVTIHVYANQQEQRFLFLNNREYRAGEQMPSGVKVERIEPQGVVLSYTDQVFRLPRPR